MSVVISKPSHTPAPQAKEYLPSHALRKLLALQTELMKSMPEANAGQMRTPNSSQFIPQGQVRSQTGGTNALGWNLLSAGDKLRDLIVPESLASVVSSGVWSTGLDKVGITWGGSSKPPQGDRSRQAEKAREELDDLLVSACPLCESVVVGLDKPFVREDEDDPTWRI